MYSPAYKLAVFLYKRHNVGNRTDSHKVCEAVRDSVLLALKCTYQFICNSDTCIVFKFKIATLPVRINDRNGLRQGVRRKMVIRNNKLHFKLIDIFCFFNGAYSVIDSDDELNSHHAELVNCLIAQSVALCVAVRNIINHVRTLHFKV